MVTLLFSFYVMPHLQKINLILKIKEDKALCIIPTSKCGKNAYLYAKRVRIFTFFKGKNGQKTVLNISVVYFPKRQK
jgi:hypothetical protein